MIYAFIPCILLMAVKCNVPIDRRTPDSTVRTLVSIAQVNNHEEFMMIVDKENYSPAGEEISEIFKALNDSYVKVLFATLEYDDKLGNVNDVKVKLTPKGGGEPSMYIVRVRDISNQWYIIKIFKEK